MEATKIKKEDDVTITLEVQKQGTRDFYYTMKRDEPLQNLMIAYCGRRKLGDYRSLVMGLSVKPPVKLNWRMKMLLMLGSYQLEGLLCNLKG